jgi:hypothetical protein
MALARGLECDPLAVRVLAWCRCWPGSGGSQAGSFAVADGAADVPLVVAGTVGIVAGDA